MNGWVGQALDLLSEGRECALVTLCAVEGSAPAQTGAKLLVWEGGQAGTIGGGNLEWTVADQARRLLAQREQSFLLQDYPLGALLRQCCGGYVRVSIERLDAGSAQWIGAVAAELGQGRSVAIRTVWSENGIEKTVMEHTAEDSSDPDAAILLYNTDGPVPAGTRIARHVCCGLIEILRPQNLPLYVFGAGHVGQATARVLQTLPFDITWIDSRPGMFPSSAVAPVRMIETANPIEQIRIAPDGALYLIFTHSHDLDFEIVVEILRENRFRYCGLIGSRTKRARFVRRLRDAGIPETAIARLICPIGLPALKSKAPAVIAIAIAAEIAAFAKPTALKEEPQVSRPFAHGH